MPTDYRSTEHDLVVREIQRLHCLGRTVDDIALLIGANPHDIQMLIYGTDEPEVVE